MPVNRLNGDRLERRPLVPKNKNEKIIIILMFQTVYVLLNNQMITELGEVFIPGYKL